MACLSYAGFLLAEYKVEQDALNYKKKKMESKENLRFYCDHTRIMFDTRIRVYDSLRQNKAQFWNMVHGVQSIICTPLE